MEKEIVPEIVFSVGLFGKIELQNFSTLFEMINQLFLDAI